MKRKKKNEKVKRIKKAIGRLTAPPSKIIPDKRKTVQEEEARKEIESA